MPEADRIYIPAAGYDWLLPLYDPLVKLMGGESAHRQLIDQANLRPGQRIFEIGCGTGNLTILVKTLHPSVDIVGLDPDPKALDRARRKADRHRVSVELDRGFSDDLHYPDASYDRVLSAFMFHHLERDEKKQTVHEIRRVLRPGGSVHLVDFGGLHDPSGRFLARLLHRSEHVLDNSGETILTLMREVGLEDPKEVAHRRTIFGRIFYYRASRPLPVEVGAV
jgi:ubiquinone/menaquinone biosynthesis C-methylase UbiE